MHDYELLRLVPGQSGPRVVHVRRRFEERDVLQAEADWGGLGLFLRAPGAAVALRELVGDEESDVVASALVGAARVSEANNDGRFHAAPTGHFASGFLVRLGRLHPPAGAEEAREPKAGDSVLRGPLLRQEKPLRSPLQLRPPRPPRRTAPRLCRRPPSPRR